MTARSPWRPGVEISFVPMGHLLGSAAVQMTLAGGRRIVFGGDLGRFNRPVLQDPRSIPMTDVLLVESTYGDRIHEPDDDGERLAGIIKDTVAGGGRVIIPSFAIGRVEEVLYWIKKLEDEQRIPILPVYLDSPMANEALAFYGNRARELDPEFMEHGGKLAGFTTRRFTAVTSTQQSKDVTRSVKPAIVISVERHGHRRARPALSACDAARSAQHDPVCRLPGGGHARPSAGRWRQAGEDARPAHRRPRAHREDRLDVGARRCIRDREVAHRASPGRRRSPTWCTASRRRRPRWRTRIATELSWKTHAPAHGETVDL